LLVDFEPPTVKDQQFPINNFIRPRWEIENERVYALRQATPTDLR